MPILFWAVILFPSCSLPGPDIKESDPTRPVLEEKNRVQEVITTNTKEGKIQFKLTAPIDVLTDSSRIFPEGLEVILYDSLERKKGLLKANYGYFDMRRGQFHARDSVFLEDLTQQQTLKTSQLTWSIEENFISSDTFVTIETPKFILKGKGMTAKDDFSDYEILEIHGTIEI